jgi:predicted PurR-regulated permease PerM
MRVERQVLFWLAALLLAVLALLALKDVLLPFLIGVVVAYALNPLADRLARIGLGRTLASGLIVAVLVVVIVVLLVFLVPLLSTRCSSWGCRCWANRPLPRLVEGCPRRLGDRLWISR